MSKAMIIVGIIIVGVLTLGVVNIVQNYQTGNELDYYLLEETTEAAMYDAVDLGYYRSSGILRVDREKFLESFVRRFAENVNQDRDYQIRVIDFNETPPKVSIQVGSGTVASFAGDQFDIVNTLDAILETKYNEERELIQVQ